MDYTSLKDLGGNPSYGPIQVPPRHDDCRPGKDAKPAPKHSHYHRDVSNLQGMDWYRFCEVFGVTHPCAQHAGKKIVFAGMRGAKDIDKDIQEAIDTLQRWQQMRWEDSIQVGREGE